MSKYLETWHNALNQVQNWKPGTNHHQQMLKEQETPTTKSGERQPSHIDKVKALKDRIDKQKDKVDKFDLGDPKQKTPYAIARADLKAMQLKMRDMQTAENEPETDDVGKPNKKKEIKERQLIGFKDKVVEKISPFLISYSKDGQHAGFKGADSLTDLQNMAQMLRAKGFTIDKMGKNTAKKMVKEGVQVYRVSHPSKKTWEVEGKNEKEAIRRYKDEVGLKSDAGIKTLLLKDVGEELDEGMKIANLVGQSIAHLGMYVELAEDVKKEYFKTNSQVSMFTKAKADQVSKNVPKLIKELRRPGIWSEQVDKADNAVKFWEDKQLNEALRDMEDYRAKSKVLQSIQNDPKQMSDPEMKVAVMKRKEKLNRELQDLKAKQARQKPIAAEVEPGTIVKEEYIIEAPFSVEYKGTKNAKEKQRGANIAREVGGKIKVDASDEDGAKRMVKRILTKRMNKGDEYLRRFELGQVRAEDFKSFRETPQPGFAVRYLDPKNGKRFAVAYKIKKDADDKAAQLKKDGAKDISITKHTLNFKEDSNVKYKVVDAKTNKPISDLKDKSVGYNTALLMKKQKGPGYEIKPVDAYGNIKEVAPPGWEGSVRAMKKHPELGGEKGDKNIYALSWYLKNKGAKPHYKDKGGKPVKKDKYQNEAKILDEALRDMEDYRAKSKVLQSIQNDPKQMSDPEMKVAVMKRKEKLNRELQDLKAKQARQKPIAAEVEPGTIVKEEYIIEAPFSVEYKGTKNAKEKQRGANIAREVGGKIKVDASDEDGAKRMVKRILTKRMNKGDEYLRRFELGQVRAEDFKSFRETPQPGFAVRYLDPKNGKRFAVAYKIKKDADDKAAQLKKDGAKDISITKHTLNFKEDSNVKYKVVDAKTNKPIPELKDKSVGYNTAIHMKKQKGPGYEIKPVDAFGNPVKEEKSFEDLKHKSQPNEVRENFSPSQLSNLRKQWATVKTINPTGDKYKALVKWINDKEFDMVDALAKAKINFVSYIAKKALMDKWGFKKDTINKMYGGLLSNQKESLTLDTMFKEVSPPGWEGSVRAMKKHPELGGEDGKDGKNIYALAWYLKNKGAKPHYKDKGGKPVKKDKYKNEQTEHEYAQQISGVENEGRKETINE